MHFGTATTGLNDVARNLAPFADLGLDIYITEFDVMTDWHPNPAEEARRQADVYGAMLRVCVEQPACKAFQTWGLSGPPSTRCSAR